MTADIAANLQEIRAELASLPGRSPDLKLIAVSKTKPVEMMLEAFNAGHTLFGENKVQEARDKIPHLPPEADVHLIGPLQSNKIKYCPALFSTIHSIAKAETLKSLSSHYSRGGKTLSALIQMNLCSEDSKSGLLDADGLHRLLDECLDLPGIAITGLMTIPDPELSELEVAKVFSQLREMRDKAANKYGVKDSFKELSMGMSSDYKIAVREGATFIRIGSAIFGERHYPAPAN